MFRSISLRRIRQYIARTIFALFCILGVATAPAHEGACDAARMSDAQLAAYRSISVEMMHLIRERRDVYRDELCAIPEDKLARAILKSTNPMPDHPGEAVSFRNLQEQDENGNIPAEGLVQAMQQAAQLRSTRAPLGAGISSGAWTWLGPGNVGGRIRSILIHPTNPNTMWAGSVSGGIWKTTNGGATWAAVNDFMANLAVSTLAMQPNNSNIMYAGTGEGFYNGEKIRGAGIFKSTDGGTLWAQLPSTNNANFYYVNRLAISPDSATILAATDGGIFRSTNSGATWTQTMFDSQLTDVKFHPTNSNLAVAASFWGRAYYSTSGGANWTLASGIPGAGSWTERVEVAYAPSSPTTVYAGVNRNSGEVWRSIDGGQTYSLINTGTFYMGTQGWYDNAIWVDPTNANFIVVGGIDLYRSTNGGTTLNKISQWASAPNSAHADNHAIVSVPNYNSITNPTVFIGNDGGIYKAANLTTVSLISGWQELNNNLGITQFYGAAGNNSTGTIVGGTQDNGTDRYRPADGTENWATTFGGDGGFESADQTNANYFYGEYVYGCVHRSSDGGASASYICGEYWNGSSWAWKSPPYLINDALNGNANFITPLVLDPNNAQRLLVGGASLWRTNDARTANTNSTGPSWSIIKASTGSNISTLAIQSNNSDVIWVGDSNGDVYKTTNGTATLPTWTKMDDHATVLPNRYVSRITVDPNNAPGNTVYISFGGYSQNFLSDNVWRTTDGGSSWSPDSGLGGTALPAAPVRSLVVYPTNPNWLYVGSEVGVFTSQDAGATWSGINDGPANVSVDELFWMGTKLIAATHGRGLFSTTPGTGTCYTLITNVSPGGTGSINANPAPDCSEQYSSGTVVTLTASPNTGYGFSYWSGDATGGVNPTTVTMSTPRSVMANFVSVPDTSWYRYFPFVRH